MLITFLIFKINYCLEHKNNKITSAYRLLQQHFILQFSKAEEKVTAVQKHPDQLGSSLREIWCSATAIILPLCF